MSLNAQKRWLVAYDIRCPKRLGRVYRYLSKHALHTQYSAFIVKGSEWQLQKILLAINQRIDARVDDVRAYHVPVTAEVWALGTQFAMEGCSVTDELLGELLIAANENHSDRDDCVIA